MKKFTTLLFSLFLVLGYSAQAASVNSEDFINSRYDGKAYIFVEGGVEFSVYPDGQFDFVYVGSQEGDNVAVQINTTNVNISYNSGYDYEAYVQYDDYGAVIQVEEVAVYYDEYGRIIQAGEVEIRYRNRRIVNVGGLFVHYNSYGYYSHCTGYINFWNRSYVFRPWHVFYARPFYTNCIVYDYAYRSYYSPIRYSYYNHRSYYTNRHHSAYANGRRSFYRPGMRTHHRNGRSVANRGYNPRRVNTAASSNRRAKGSLANNVNSRGITKNDRGTVQANSVNNSRGVAKRDNSSLKSKPSNTRGIAKRDNNISSRPSNSRGIAKTRPSTSSSQRGISKKRPSTSSSQRGISQKPKATSRPQQKRSSVSQRSQLSLIHI